MNRATLLVAVLAATMAGVQSQKCGGKYKDQSGTFTSPDYPNNYPNKKKCKYVIDTGYPVTITCSEFDIVCSDSLMVKDKKTRKGTKFCGSNVPTDYKSTGKVILKFKSNKKKQGKGFSCSYSSDTGSGDSDLLTAALSQYEAGTCDSTQQSNCGCTGITSADSEFHETVSGQTRIVVTNGIPNHKYEVGQEVANPNNACPHELFMAVPANPVKGNTYTAYGMGPVGIATSGGFFFNHLSSPSGDVAIVNEGESFDTCNGHSDPNCRYHYHLLPKCLAPGEDCAKVGYMLDGFAVYTYCPRESGSGYLKSCYQLTDPTSDGSQSSHYAFNQTALTNGDCDLDLANGYTFSDGRGYAYIFTEDYPFIMAGYYGTEKANLCYLSESTGTGGGTGGGGGPMPPPPNGGGGDPMPSPPNGGGGGPMPSPPNGGSGGPLPPPPNRGRGGPMPPLRNKEVHGKYKKKN